MLLGDLIRDFDDQSKVAETVLRAGDVRLLAAMRAGAAEAGPSLGVYAARSVRLYMDTATEDEWVNLMGAIERSDDPGLVCLERAFAHAISARKLSR